MHEQYLNVEESDLSNIREQVLSSLDPAVQSEIKRLTDKAPKSKVTDYFLKTLELRRANKIIELDKILNRLDESIGSLSIIDDPEEQVQAVKSIEAVLSPYVEEADKEKALSQLEQLLG